MIISGIQGQKKKTSLKVKSNSRPKPVSHDPATRPYSSEYKIEEAENKLLAQPHPLRKKDRPKDLSQNKITFTNGALGKREEREDRSEKNIKMEAAYLKSKAQKPRKQNPQEIVSARPANDQVAKIEAFFRYSPVSVIAVCGFKEAMMKDLMDRRDIGVINPYKKPNSKKDLLELWVKLTKNAQLKGKYRYREKFNYAYSAQLKALDYKRKEYKKKKDSSSSQSEQDKKQKCRDIEAWKKSMGVEGKVFIIKGRYPDLKEALLKRGWVENTDKKSTFYDLRWTTKISDVNFETLRPNQIVNHFDNNACLTSKYGIIKSLRSVMHPQAFDIDQFFPKAYDLSDLSDFQNFIEMFKLVYCESILKKFLLNIEEIPIAHVKLAVIVTERRLAGMENILAALHVGRYALCSNNEWKFLQGEPHNEEQIESTIGATIGEEGLLEVVKDVLGRLKQVQPQYELNGYRNIWIVKPAYLSRGRGIKCISDLNDILDASLGKQTQYVVQKYIQNPLIIGRRKFDIRMWVVIEDYCPPKIWFYEQYYLRFCLEDYNPEKLKNKYSHLTNNSIQKYNTKVGKADLDESMWDRPTFQKFMCETYGEAAFKEFMGRVKEIVVAAVISTADQVQGKKGSFEHVGYDMMVDENLCPWLIEINSSPSVDKSTPVTKRLVGEVMEDIVKIVVDNRKKKAKQNRAGQFKCLYSGGVFKHKYYQIQTGSNP